MVRVTVKHYKKKLGMSTEISAKVEKIHHYGNTIDGDKLRPTNPVQPRGTLCSIQETIHPLSKLASVKGWGATDDA